MATETELDKPDPVLATGKLFHALAADPRYRKKVLSLIKEASPETPIPELDMEGALDKRVEERLKPQAEDTKKTNERLDAMEKRIAREAFAKQNDLGEDELVEVETLAKEGGISKAETAVEFWRAKQASGTPRSTRKSPPGTMEYLDKLSKTNPRNFKQLKHLATEEAVRLMTGRRAG